MEKVVTEGSTSVYCTGKVSGSEPIGFLKLYPDTGNLRPAFEAHRFGNEAPDLLCCLHKVRVGKVGIARRRAVPLVTE